MRTALLALALLAGSAAADTLALKDGRFFEGRPIDKTDQGYVIKFENGEIVVPEAMVLDFFEEDDQGGFVPKTDREKEKFAKGYVPYRGRWVQISYRERMRKKEKEERRLSMEQAKARRYWRHHATVKTKRFIFLHTLPDGVFQEFKDLFATYYDFFTKYWGFRPSSKFGKVTINIYHDREYFEQVSGAPSGVVGWYMPTEKDLHFYYDRQNHRYTIDVMFHEGNHMLTHMINEKMWYPWWIGEGMAEYFGASEWNPKDKTMKLGRVQSGRLAVLHTRIKDDKMLKLKDLLEAERMGAVEYAWTWSFCHFLLHTPKYAKKFKKYFMAIGRDSSLRRVARFLTTRQLSREEQVASFKKYLRVKDLEALQKEWYDYIKNQLALERQELNWGEAGYIMDMYGEFAKARRFYKKAIDNGSKEAYVHYGYAKLKQRQKMPGVAVKYAKKATESDPLHARAWSLLGEALYKKGEETGEGLRLLKLACELDPDDPQIWYALEFALQKERDKKEKEEAG
ncbi:MAG: tetratricopeptide repeat protein [Planctomycetota bacterium]|jgi:hypothetical protein